MSRSDQSRSTHRPSPRRPAQTARRLGPQAGPQPPRRHSQVPAKASFCATFEGSPSSGQHDCWMDARPAQAAVNWGSTDRARSGRGSAQLPPRPGGSIAPLAPFPPLSCRLSGAVGFHIARVAATPAVGGIERLIRENAGGAAACTQVGQGRAAQPPDLPRAATRTQPPALCWCTQAASPFDDSARF